MEDKGSYSQVCWCKLVLASLFASVMSSLLFWYRVGWEGGIWGVGVGTKHPFTAGNLCPALRQLQGGQRALPAFADSQWLSTQNNPYAKEAYSGVVNSDPLPRENHQEPNLFEDLVPWLLNHFTVTWSWDKEVQEPHASLKDWADASAGVDILHLEYLPVAVSEPASSSLPLALGTPSCLTFPLPPSLLLHPELRH